MNDELKNKVVELFIEWYKADKDAFELLEKISTMPKDNKFIYMQAKKFLTKM